MKENKYDDDAFYRKYAAMPRSQKGLGAAGEWHELRKLLPELKDKKVLDLGCGYGWHCAYAAEKGAQVLGTDISAKMLAKAEEICPPSVRLVRAAMEDLAFDSNSFDLVISSLALHYISDYYSLVKNVYSWLRPQGEFIFSVEHPSFTAEGRQDWCYGEKGEKLHFPLDNYFSEGQRQARFLGEEVTKFHRTLTTYLQTLLAAGFTLAAVVEPQPPPALRNAPEMADEYRRPMMLIVKAVK